ncbi:MAG TPA: hypothetical protein VGJ73_03990 [Verrucomicrobiae bacterium]|jgi:hypothetical protein
MSMDLAVWSARPFNLPAELPQSSAWEHAANEFAFSGKGWHVLVLPSEDEPDEEVVSKLPDAAHVAYVSLEPIGADAAGYKMLETVVRDLARKSNGVWVDANGEPYRHDEGSF